MLAQFPPPGAPDADPGVPDDVQALALNIGSRHLGADAARARSVAAARYLRRAGCREFYLKVDSTLRGNIGAEITGLMAELALDLAVVAPAFPDAGRLTVGGFQLVDGVPVALSGYGRDPLLPVSESHVPTLLGDCGLEVATIDLRTVLAGWEAIAGALAECGAAGARAVVVDAARSADLDQVARAMAQVGRSVLPVGSAGLAAALATRPGTHTPLLAIRQGGRTAVGRILGRTAPILVVSGSPNPTTLEQIKHLGATARLVLLDVKQLLLTDEEHEDWDLHQELAMAAKQALQGLLAGCDVVVTTALSAEQVAKDQDLGRHLGMVRGQVGERLAHALGALARHLHGQADLGGLVATGGETASAVCQALPGDRLEIVEEVLPAVPLARVVGWQLRVVTKSGGFGSPDTLRQIVEYLRQKEEVA